MPMCTPNDVIVADSDRILRGILRSLLDTSGFNVLLAVDGLEAIDYATRTLARLVILDFNMPNLDGLAACGQIRRLPGYADVPIAILTSSDNENRGRRRRLPAQRCSLASPSTRLPSGVP